MISGKREYCHEFRCLGHDKTASSLCLFLVSPYKNTTQGSVTEVNSPVPKNPFSIEAKRIPPKKEVIHMGCNEIVGKGDRVSATGTVKIDFLLRDKPRLSTPGAASLTGEVETRRRLPQGGY